MKHSGTEMGLNVSIVQKMLILNGAIFCHHARASASITSGASEISCVFSANEWNRCSCPGGTGLVYFLKFYTVIK